jgi:imidazolonepropionase-like amidohydrolase
MQALQSATLRGGEVMMRPGELGLLKDGYLADLLLIDGDPLADITVLQKPDRMLAIMKDGVFVKAPVVESARSALRLSA